MIDDLLDITRITHGKIRIRREPLDLGALVRSAIDDYRATFQARDLRIESRFPPDEIWLLGDRDRLIQILSNLLGNAEKFTPSGGTVTVAVEVDQGNALLRVTDTGIGIAQDVIEGLFEPFAQARHPLDGKQRGVGLGLALVKGTSSRSAATPVPRTSRARRRRASPITSRNHRGSTSSIRSSRSCEDRRLDRRWMC